jgi:hypothetical protein
MNRLGSVMTNAWGGNIYQFTNPLQVEYSYNFDNNTYAAVCMGRTLKCKQLSKDN